MLDVVERFFISVFFFGSLTGLGAVWLTVPAFVGYLVFHKIKRGCFKCPFGWIDVLAFLFMGHVLMATWWVGPRTHCAKGGSNLVIEMFSLGAAFSVLLCARIPILWRHPEWRLRFSILTAVLMLVISIAVGALVPSIGEC